MKENSIEEDIKIVEDYLENSAINETDSNFFENGGWETVDLEIPKSMQHILSDYKRVLKELDKQQTTINKYTKEIEKAVTKCNELENEKKELKKEIKSWKKYSAEQEENIIEKNNIICNLEFQIEKLQKENEGLKERIREHTLLISPYYVKENFIPVQIIKDFIKKYQKLGDKFYEKFLETNRTDKDLHDVGLACDAKVQVLQELLEGRKNE